MRFSEPTATLFCVAIATMLVLFPGTFVFGQDELTQVMERAREQYIVSDWEECVETVGDVIATIENQSDTAALNTETETLLIKAYELRALANFNLKQEEAARADVTRILALRPLHKLTEEFSFPVIADFFEVVRRQTVGYLTVTTTPPGAQVFLDGKELGRTDLARLPLLAGEHSIRLEKEGYAPAEQVISVAPNVESTLMLSLERTTASIELWTSPSDVEMFLDGKRLGLTSGVAEEAMRAGADALGIPLERISARYTISGVSLGNHTLEFRKDCFRTEKRILPEITVARDYSIGDPIVLTPATGNILLENVPARARVFINEEEQDRGKMGFEGLCPGTYAVRVMSDFGRFSVEVTVKDGATQSIPVKLRPGILLSPPVYATGGAADSASDTMQTLATLMAGIETFERVSPKETMAGETRALLEVFPRIKAGEDRLEIDARLHGIVRQLCRANDVQIVAVPVFPESRNEKRFRLLFFSYEIPSVEAATIALDDDRGMRRFVAQLGNQIPFFGTWHGITAVDTRIHDGPVVLAVQPGSPADHGGIAPGEVIVAVDGEPVAGYRTLQETLAGKAVGEKIVLTVSEKGENVDHEIVLAQSPVLLPLNNAPVFYNAAIASFSLAAETAEDDEKLNLARLNSAIALAHFDAWEEAIQYLKRVELGNGAGVNQGTVYYYIGRGYEHLGYTTEALDYYNRALTFKNATLDSNDGPPLLPRLQQRIGRLQQNGQ